MEDILASIRRIISDDSGVAPRVVPAEPAVAAAPVEARKPVAPVVAVARMQAEPASAIPDIEAETVDFDDLTTPSVEAARAAPEETLQEWRLPPMPEFRKNFTNPFSLPSLVSGAGSVKPEPVEPKPERSGEQVLRPPFDPFSHNRATTAAPAAPVRPAPASTAQALTGQEPVRPPTAPPVEPPSVSASDRVQPLPLKTAGQRQETKPVEAVRSGEAASRATMKPATEAETVVARQPAPVESAKPAPVISPVERVSTAPPVAAPVVEAERRTAGSPAPHHDTESDADDETVFALSEEAIVADDVGNSTALVHTSHEPLLSDEANASITDAFDKLAASMLAEREEEMGDMVERMMRPMLKHWLEDNLPTLVEKIVREEIERVSRGR